MVKAHNPRHGSMQFWPRKRSNRPYARIRSWPTVKEAKPVGFAGYKVGMTHVLFEEVMKNSKKKATHMVSTPVTIIECPPLKIASVRFYSRNDHNQLMVAKEVLNATDKELTRKLHLPKKKVEAKLDDVSLEGIEEIRINVYTQPKLTTIGKKKPELFELALGGNTQDQLTYVKEHLDKEIKVEDVLNPGQQLDVHAVTKGKGFQGPVKRFGVNLRGHKSEKVRRGPGSLGGWISQAHTMYRIAHAGQMGYHTRTEFNKWLLKVSDKADEINPKDGFGHYGLVKNSYILVKGSVGGAKKRLVKLVPATRPRKNIPSEAPKLKHVSKESKQGN